MLKRLLPIILLCGLLMLTACANAIDTTNEIPSENSTGDTITPTASTASDISTPEASGEKSTPDNSNTQSVPTKTDDSTPSNSSNSTPKTDSSPTPPPVIDPPASSTQSPPQPATSTPAPTTSSTPPPTPSTPVYTEADYQAIINEIKRYGESKGFMWENSYAFGQDGLGYYGRPNLERDGYDSVISRLKLHCDKIATDVGVCFFMSTAN